MVDPTPGVKRILRSAKDGAVISKYAGGLSFCGGSVVKAADLDTAHTLGLLERKVSIWRYRLTPKGKEAIK